MMAATTLTVIMGVPMAKYSEGTQSSGWRLRGGGAGAVEGSWAAKTELVIGSQHATPPMRETPAV